MPNIITSEKYQFTMSDGTRVSTKGQFEKWLKNNRKYHIIKSRDVEIERKRIEQNQKDKNKRELHKTVEEVYKEVRR